MKFSKEFSDALGFKSFKTHFEGFLKEYPTTGRKLQEVYDDGIINTAMKCITIITDIGIDPENYVVKEQYGISVKDRLAEFKKLERERRSVQKASEVIIIDSSSTTDDVTELSVEFLHDGKPLTLPMKRLPDEIKPEENKKMKAVREQVQDKEKEQVQDKEKEQVQDKEKEKELMKGYVQKLEAMNDNFSNQIKKQNMITLNQCKEIDNLNIQKNTLEKKVTSLHNDLTKSIALNNDLRAKNQSLIEKYNGIVKFSDRVKSEKNDLIVFMRKMKWF